MSFLISVPHCQLEVGLKLVQAVLTTGKEQLDREALDSLPSSEFRASAKALKNLFIPDSQLKLLNYQFNFRSRQRFAQRAIRFRFVGELVEFFFR